MNEKTALKIEELEEEINHLIRYANQCEEFGGVGKAKMLYQQVKELRQQVDRLKSEV